MTETAVFGGGCFWCTEAVFKSLKGVTSVMPGYAGGTVPNPTYEQVCGGRTGHIEVTRVEFDPSVISYRDLLTVFFATHDPTTKNRQGADVGPQYRSAIFTAGDTQRVEAAQFIKELDADGGAPIVTEVRPLEAFYPAEEYHRDYYLKNEDVPYCQLVISPKLKKLRERFNALLAE